MNPQPSHQKSIAIFDFDNTLVKTEAVIKITKIKTGEIFEVHSDQYELYENDSTVTIDLEHFENVSDYKIIWDTFDKLHEFHISQIETHIVSARHSPLQIQKFCKDNNFINTKVSTLSIPIGDNNGIHKANHIRELIKKNNYSKIEFYDDRIDCITEVKKLANEFTSACIEVYRVIDSKKIIKF